MDVSPMTEMIADQVADADQAAELVALLMKRHQLSISVLASDTSASYASGSSSSRGVMLDPGKIRDVLHLVRMQFQLKKDGEFVHLLDEMEDVLVDAVMFSTTTVRHHGFTMDWDHTSVEGAVYDMVNQMRTGTWTAEAFVVLDDGTKKFFTPDDGPEGYPSINQAWTWAKSMMKDNPDLSSCALVREVGDRREAQRIKLKRYTQIQPPSLT